MCSAIASRTESETLSLRYQFAHAGAANRAFVSAALGAVAVDDDGAFADNCEDDFLGLIEWVDVPVNQPGWDMEKATFLDVYAVETIDAELKSCASADDIADHVTIAVMVPTRHRMRLRPSTHERRVTSLECNLAEHARRRGARVKVGRPDRGDSFGHDVQASSHMTADLISSGVMTEHWRRVCGTPDGNFSALSATVHYAAAVIEPRPDSVRPPTTEPKRGLESAYRLRAVLELVGRADPCVPSGDRRSVRRRVWAEVGFDHQVRLGGRVLGDLPSAPQRPASLEPL